MKRGTLFLLPTFAVAMGFASLCAVAADPPPVTSLPCMTGEVQTYRYSSVFAGKPALYGTESWTTTECAARIVFKPSGKLFKRNIELDAQGTLSRTVSIFTGEGIEFSTGVPVFRLPLIPGKSWNAQIRETGETFHDSGSETIHVIGWEKIKVPAGEYNALKMEIDYSYAGATNSGYAYHGAYHETFWYSPDTRAVVKNISSDTAGDKATREMISVGP
jgi:hypothetical protein